jgi:hypothetical protein
MTPKLFTGLAIAAVVSFLAAAGMHGARNTWTSGRVTGETALPQLVNRADAIAAVEIRQDDKTLTFDRKGEGWTIRERANYPAKTEKVRALVVQLAKLRLVERKTAAKDRLPMLELDDPAGKKAASRLVRVLDGKAQPLAEIIVGKRKFDAFGSDKPGTYVRRPAETQAWLAEGAVDADMSVSAWIERELYKLGADGIWTLAANTNTPQELGLVMRPGKEPGQKSLEYSIVPAGKKVRPGEAAGGMAVAFSKIEAEDIRRPPPSPAADATVSKARLETESGLVLIYELIREKDTAWLTVSAAGKDKAKAEADKINARLNGWQFRLAPGTVDQLFRTPDKVFEDEKPKAGG